MSDEREQRSGEAEGELEKVSDVEAHKFQERVGEAERIGEAEGKRDKVAQTDDEADVEGHMLNPKMNRMDP